MRVVAVGLLVALLAACGGEQPPDEGSSGSPSDERVAELEQEVSDLESELADERAAREDAEQALEEARAAEEEGPDGEGAAAGDGQRPQPADERTPEGLVEQLHMYFPPEDAPEEWERATGEWGAAEIPEGFTETTVPGYGTAGELLTAFAAEIEGPMLGRDTWEVTSRVLLDDTGDAATGAVLLWGLADDAVAGVDYRFDLREGDDGWYLADAEQRPRCRRGVTGGVCQ